MGAAATTSTVPELLKEIWDDEIHDFLYEDKVLYAKLPKDTTWDGLKQKITIQYGGMNGVSNTFDDALEDRAPNEYAQMEVETSDIFGVWSVDNKLITLSRNQRGALVRALDESTEKCLTKVKRMITYQLWGNGGGAIGKIASIDGSDFVFENIDSVRHVDIGDILVFADDDGLANGGIYSGTRRVTDIDEDTGTVTVNSALAGIASLAAGDYVFPKGNYGRAFKGVFSYVTQYAPGVSGVPTSIWGMDRTDFPTRKSGHRFSASNLTVVEAIKYSLAQAFKRRARITDLFTDPDTFNDVEMQLQGAVRYVDETIGRVGFTGLEFTAQSGRKVKLWSDPDIGERGDGAKLVVGLNLPTWKLHSAEELPMWLNAKDDGKFMSEENANARQGRVGGYAQLYTKAPGENFVLALT